MFSFQSWTKSDDIRDFEIEGMSIGDSLLDYYSKEEIKISKTHDFQDLRKYYVVGIKNNLKKYEAVDLYLKTGDKNYTRRNYCWNDYHGFKKVISYEKRYFKRI